MLIGKGKACENAKVLDQALNELEDRGLIGWDREANRHDAHPIVRSVVWQLASDKARNTNLAAIDVHFEPMAVPGWQLVESLTDLTPAIERYHSLVERGRLDYARELFRELLNFATIWRLAAHRERIAMLERLFPDGTDKPPALESESAQAWTLNALAQSYDASGRPGQAVALYRLNNTIRESLRDKRSFQIGLANRARAQREAGALRGAMGTLRQALLLSRRQEENSFHEAATLQQLGQVAATAGNHEPAYLSLGRSGTIFKKEDHGQAEGIVSATLAELFLWWDGPAAAEQWADRAWQLANLYRGERDFIQAALLQGQAALERGDQVQAEERLHHALARARAANVVNFELPALIAIAELELARDNTKSAREPLDEIWEPAEEGPYPLYQADACNVLADICLAEGDKPVAIEAVTKAYRAAWCDGPPWAYHWGLEKAKAHLRDLRAPEPDMPPFDESKYEPLPEVEINPKDDNWVDPNVPLESLLDLETGEPPEA